MTQEVTYPQDHWTVVGAIKAARALIKAADDLSFAAQITGGTAGRDAALCAAIAQWTAERDKQKQVLRIIELEGNDPANGAGFELIPSAHTEAAELKARADALEEAAKVAEGEATCGCKCAHGRCMVDDAPLAIAAAIRALATQDTPNAE